MSHPQNSEIREIINYCDRMIEFTISNLNATLKDNSGMVQVNLFAESDHDVSEFLKENNATLMFNLIKQNEVRVIGASKQLNLYIGLKTTLQGILKNEETKEIIINE